MELETILDKNYIQDLIKEVCGHDTEIVKRRDSFAVRSKVESDRDIYRIILLPPQGFTANEINQMNSHDEAEKATIEVKGAVKENKHAFSKLKDCLLVASTHENGTVSDLHEPYLTFNLGEENKSPDLIMQKHSSGKAPFYVVKNDGFGFYHNLVNLTDDWLVLKLHKVLRAQKKVNLEPLLKNMQDEEASIYKELYNSIIEIGDNIFKERLDLINKIVNLPLRNTMPMLSEMLYIHDSGMHEACSVFALILKISKRNPEGVIKFLKTAIKENVIPVYYANQLIGKIERYLENNPSDKINQKAA